MNPQEQLEHFEILRREDGSWWELGRGAMGVTYKAWDTHLRCAVALKLIHAALVDSEDMRERFLREARAAAQLRHPNIASATHLGNTGDGGLFYVMEFCDGITLQEEVMSRQRLDVRTGIEVALQVSRALVAAEAQHIVHRDIKPSNIMLVRTPGEELVVKVIDFGLARNVAPSAVLTYGSMESGGFMGTVHYASPEQLDEGELDSRSDFYSLGGCLWFMLVGRPVFDGPVARVMAQVLSSEPAWVDVQHHPAPVVGLLKHLLAKAPEDRPLSARSLRDELESCSRNLQASPSTRRIPTPILNGKTNPPPPSTSRPHVSAGLPPQHRERPRGQLRPVPETAKNDLILGFCRPTMETGRDALGIVLNGVDTRSGRATHIRLCDPAVLKVPAIRRRHVDFVEGLLAHPHASLPRILGCGDHAGEWAVVSEPIAGVSAQYLLKARGRLTPLEALDLLAPVADATAHAEGHNLASPELRMDAICIASTGRPGQEQTLLATPLSNWGGFHVILDALSPSSELSTGASGTLTSMPTMAPGARRAGQGAGTTGTTASLASLLCELLGSPPPTNGQHVPLPRLNEAANHLLREASRGGTNDAAAFLRQLRTALGSQLQTSGAHPPPRTPARSVSHGRHGTSRTLSQALIVVGVVVLCGVAWMAWYHHVSDQREQQRAERERVADAEAREQLTRAEQARIEAERHAAELAQARQKAQEAQLEQERDSKAKALADKLQKDRDETAKAVADQQMRHRLEALQSEVERQSRESADAKRKLEEMERQKDMAPKPEAPFYANPAPAIPQAPPGPTDADRQSVLAFLKNWWEHNLSNDEADWAGDYANPATYCYKEDGGRASRSFIMEDRRKLISRWPIRRYQILEGGNNFDIAAGGASAILRIKYRYFYSGGGKNASGVSTTKLDLTRSGSGWVITAFDEKVDRN